MSSKSKLGRRVERALAVLALLAALGAAAQGEAVSSTDGGEAKVAGEARAAGEAKVVGEPKVAIVAPDPETLSRGMHVYQRYCLSCHGEFGDGRGVSAPYLDPRPRDFTKGVYKWRSTPTGTLPIDDDINRTIRSGLYNTNMPRWSGLTEGQLWDVTLYVESFSPLFGAEPRGRVVSIPGEPAATPESIEAGKSLFQTMGCFNCHGPEGRGDGPSALTLMDDWGRPIRPFDFSGGHLKCGGENRDIYRVFMTGLNGTPMPSYADAMTPEQAWNLVHFLRTLMVPR